MAFPLTFRSNEMINIYCTLILHHVIYLLYVGNIIEFDTDSFYNLL